eukprot:12546127-Alexandrium_andersonii.AAC.1
MSTHARTRPKLLNRLQGLRRRAGPCARSQNGVRAAEQALHLLGRTLLPQSRPKGIAPCPCWA